MGVLILANRRGSYNTNFGGPSEIFESCSYHVEDGKRTREQLCFEHSVARSLRAALRARGESRKCTRQFFQDFQHHKLDPNSRNKIGATALHAAANSGKCNEARFLLNWLSANVDARDQSGMTPLHVAVWRGHLDIVTVLLRAGADPSPLCTFTVNSVSEATFSAVQFTPLHFAVLKGYKLMANLLLEQASMPRDYTRKMRRSSSDTDLLIHAGCFGNCEKSKMTVIREHMAQFSRSLRKERISHT